MSGSRSASDRERVAHVVRRLSMGVHPDRLDGPTGADAAIDAALDLGTAPAPPLALPVPPDAESARDIGTITGPITWWLDRMRSGDRMIEERLVWFWHDHFATSLAKVRIPYLMWRQHLTLRENATTNFRELLHAIARDPAMLVYLDGAGSTVGNANENFGRECLELFTMGREGGYTQDDVVAASRACTGWVVNVPGRPASARLGAEPWSAVFVPGRHDAGTKTLLGTSAPLDMDGALDVVLSHPSTARFVAAKLHRELVGVTPSAEVTERLAKDFRRNYEIMPLVEAIVRDDSFTSDEAVRAKYRTPLEQLVGIVQAGQAALSTEPGRSRRASSGRLVGEALRSMSFLPFVPPNVGGFPEGERLVGPHSLVHTFDLLHAVSQPPAERVPVDDLFARFGIFDVSDRTRDVVAGERDPARRFALVATSPEFSVV